MSDCRGAIIAGPQRNGTYRLVAPGFVHPEHLKDYPGFRNQSFPRNLVPADVEPPQRTATPLSFGPWTLRQYQRDTLSKIWEPNARGNVVGLDVGLGKMQPLDAKVATPTGWTTIGDLRFGNEVLTPSGVERVQAFSAVQDAPVYRVTFNDGAQTECSLDHLWLAQTTNHRKRGQRGVVMTLEELLADWTWSNGTTKWYTPEYQAVEKPEAALPIDPWLLGVLLGDGGFTQAQLTFTNSEDDIVRRVNAQLAAHKAKLKRELSRPGNYRVLDPTGQLRNTLRELGLLGLYSTQKHVPYIYLHGSIAQRVALLQGLTDTDGDIHADGSCITFNTSSPQLSDAVVELVRSLAGEANASERAEPHYTYKGEECVGEPAFRVTINLPNYCCVSSNKHTERWRPFTKRRPARGFKSAEYVGEKTCQCIQVSGGQGLYFTDDYIITHNTVIALTATANLRPTVVLAPKQSASVWCNDDSDPAKLGLRVYRCEGKKAAPIGYNCQHDIVFCHYEIVKWWLHELQRLTPRSVVFDEAHVLRNPTTNASQAAINLTGLWTVNRRLVLTATPIVNSVMDLWMLLHLAEPGGWGKRSEFGLRYAGYIMGEYGWQMTGETNVEELRMRMQRTMVVKYREEVRDELPDLSRTPIRVSKDALDPELMQQYRTITLETREWLRENQRSTIGAVLQKYTAGASTLSMAKRDVALACIDDMLIDHQKLLVLCWYKETAEYIYKQLQARKVPSWVVHGEMSETKRQRCRQALNDLTDSCGVMVATLGTTQMSINSLTCCSGLLFVDLYWLPSVLHQAEGRLHREGQQNDVDVRYLIAEHSMDQIMFNALEDRAAVSKRLADDPKSVSVMEALGPGKTEETALASLLDELDEDWEI